MRLWLERSGSLTMSLCLYQDDLEEDGVVTMRQILILCVSHVQRWREVTLDLDRSVQLDELLNLSRDSFGTFRVFLCGTFGLERVAYGTTLQGASTVSVSSASCAGTLIWILPEECRGNNFQPLCCGFRGTFHLTFAALSVLRADLLVRAVQPRKSTVLLLSLIDLRISIVSLSMG